MRVAIIGGTGGVGRWLIAIARENGDHVKLLVRDRRKLPSDLGAIGVIEGDVRDQEAVDATIGGCDVVFSALGSDGGGPTDVYSVGFRTIITAMHKSEVTRLIAITSAGVDEDPNMGFLARRVVLPLMLGRVLADMKLGEEEIERSNLVYTIVRPMRLTDGSLSRERPLHAGARQRDLARRRRRLHVPHHHRRAHAAQDRRTRVLIAIITCGAS